MSTDMIRAVFFRGNSKVEELIVVGNQHTLLPGTVLKYLLETNEKFFEELSKIADGILTILAREQELDSEYDREIFETITMAKSVLHLSAPMLLKELMFLLPALTNYAEALRKEEQVHFSTLELAEYEYKLLKDDRSLQERDADIKAFFNRRGKMTDSPAQTVRWHRWVTYLVEDTTFKELSFQLNAWEDWKEMLELIRQYGRDLHAISIEAQKLKRVVAIAVGLEKSQYISKSEATEELICCTEPVELLREKEERRLFADSLDKGGIHGYATTSLATLVSFEMQLFVQHILEFRQCEFCGGYFATRNSKSKYCKYPNEAYGGQTCQKVAPQKVYWANKQVTKEYWTSYAKYRRWINRTTAKDESKMYQYMDGIRKKLRAQYGKRKGEKIIALIEGEINNIFLVWDDNARNMIIKFKAGLVTEEQCRTAFVVPSIPERSPILDGLKRDKLNISEEDLEKAMNKPFAHVL